MSEDRKDKSAEDLSQVEPNRADLRSKIDSILITDAEFDAFCLDYFFSTYSRFSRGMDRIEKTNLLLVLNDLGKIATHLDLIQNNTVKRQRLRKRSVKRYIKKLYLILIGGIIHEYIQKIFSFFSHLTVGSGSAVVGGTIISVAVAGFVIIKYSHPVVSGRDVPITDPASTHASDNAAFRPQDGSAMSSSRNEAIDNKDSPTQHNPKDSSPQRSQSRSPEQPLLVGGIKSIGIIDAPDSCVISLGKVSDVEINDLFGIYRCSLSELTCLQIEAANNAQNRERYVTLFLSNQSGVEKVTKKLSKPRNDIQRGALIRETFDVEYDGCKFKIRLERQGRS